MYRLKNICTKYLLANKQINENILNMSKEEFYKACDDKVKELDRLFVQENIDGFYKDIDRVRNIMIKRAERKLKN